MKKHEHYYVLIENKKQAEQYKYILAAAGIDTSNFVIDDYDRNCREIGFCKRGGFWLSGGYSEDSNYKNVSIGQLIDLLNEPKKLAVKVENEKEFKALMKYYKENKLFHAASMPGPYTMDDFAYGNCFTFHDKWFSIKDDDCDYQTIPFAEFAEEKGIKLPLITSVDGVDLYENDRHTAAYLTSDGWFIGCIDASIRKNSSVMTDPSESKAFSPKQAALSWIEAQKPKEIEVCKQTIALKKSADLWNAFVDIKDSEKHVDDTNDFRFHIHALQNILYTQKHIKDHGRI